MKNCNDELPIAVLDIDPVNMILPEEGDFTEGDWNDEDDEDFEDNMEVEDDLNEIRVDDDLMEPDPEDDDHFPDDDLQ